MEEKTNLMSIYVGDLSCQITKEDLEEFFGESGKIKPIVNQARKREDRGSLNRRNNRF